MKAQRTRPIKDLQLLLGGMTGKARAPLLASRISALSERQKNTARAVNNSGCHSDAKPGKEGNESAPLD